MASNMVKVDTLAKLKALPRYNVGAVVINFYAPWSDLSKQLDTVFATLAAAQPGITFVSVEAEEATDISEEFKIESVPTFVIIDKGVVKETLVGANPPELTKRVYALAQALPAAPEAVSEDVEAALNARLKSLIESAKVMVFMKGTTDEPRCGFSNKLVSILKATEVSFSSFDILSDQTVRDGLKKYSNWPTYPQLYVNGKLIGGLDIVKELEADGELIDTLTA